MSYQASIFIFLTLITPLFFLFFKKQNKNRGSKLPPAPPKLPFIGNLHQLGAKSPHKSLLEISKKYGDLMFLQLGSVPTIVVSSCKMAQEIFKNHDLAFSNRPSLYAVTKFTNNYNISFAPYGEYWRELKKTTVLELLTLKRVESFERVRVEEVGIMLGKIAEAASSPVDLSTLVFRLSNAVICRIALGRRNNPEFDGIMHESMKLSSDFNIADYFPWLGMINNVNGVAKSIGKCKREIDSFLDQVIWEHRNKMKPELDVEEDIVDVLLRVQNDPHRSIELTMDHVKGVLIDVLFAGTDTSSATIVWTMAELIRNPHILEKLQREVREIGVGKQTIQEKDLPKLTFLKLVIKESLRLHPPAPLLLPRETTEACSIGEHYVIPKKTRVIINAIALSLDPEYWEKPEIFWPERFSDNKIDYRGQFGYLPFGTGRRICPGINFALQLVELTVANLVFRFDWEMPAGMKAEELDMEEEFGIVMQKKAPLCLVAKPTKLSILPAL